MGEKRVKFVVVKKIILATFSEVKKLQNSNTSFISAIGKPYGDFYSNIGGYFTVQGIQTDYPMFLHAVRVRDFKAANMLYRENLETIGIENLVEAIDGICIEEKTDTVVFLGAGYDNQFCYRFILADYFKDCGVDILVSNRDKIVELSSDLMGRQKSYWEKDVYQTRGHFSLTDEYVGSALEKMEWVKAKATKNPHSYTLRKSCKCDDRHYLGLVKHIRCKGKLEIYWGMVYRVWYYGDYRYWTMAEDIHDEDCDLINKAKIWDK